METFLEQATAKRLPDSEVRQLCVRAQQGSAAARERLLRAHGSLVVHVAKYFYRSGSFLELGDLVQQGCLGLLHAIEKFNPEKSAKGRLVQFATYAHYWISHSIRREIENHGRTIAVPIKRLRDSREGKRSKRFPDALIPLVATSLESVCETSDPGITCDAWCEMWDQQQQVEGLLNRLPRRTQQILRDRFGLDGITPPLTQKQVGEKLNLSGALVGMHERTALYQLRQAASEMQL